MAALKRFYEVPTRFCSAQIYIAWLSLFIGTLVLFGTRLVHLNWPITSAGSNISSHMVAL